MRRYFAPSSSARPPRTFRLIAHEQDRAARIGQALRQMVQDATAGDHAARRNDDAWRDHVVDLLGFFDRARHMHFVAVQRVVVAGLFQLREFRVVVFMVIRVQVRSR